MMRPDITYVFDAGFLVPSLISAYSLLSWRPADVTVRFLVTEDVPALDDSVAALRRAFPEAEILTRLIPFDRSAQVAGHVSATALARLKLPGLLDAPTLYLDGDTLVRRDVGAVFGIDLQGQPIGAVRDPGIAKALHQEAGRGWRRSRKSARHLRDLRRISEFVDAPDYVNSGVVLFDLPRIRALGLDAPMGDVEAAIAFRKRHDLRFNDQNWLNAVFRGKIRFLPPEWNTLWGNRLTARSPFPAAERLVFAPSRADPAIVHFTGRLRPWEVRFPQLHPKRQPWLSEYGSVAARARACLGL